MLDDNDENIIVDTADVRTRNFMVERESTCVCLCKVVSCIIVVRTTSKKGKWMKIVRKWVTVVSNFIAMK